MRTINAFESLPYSTTSQIHVLALLRILSVLLFPFPFVVDLSNILFVLRDIACMSANKWNCLNPDDGLLYRWSLVCQQVPGSTIDFSAVITLFFMSSSTVLVLVTLSLTHSSDLHSILLFSSSHFLPNPFIFPMDISSS